MNSTATLLATLAAALLVGCGGLDSPDRTLSTGQVRGQLSNAKANAYVYVFGHPEVRAEVQSDGSYVLDKVPVGNGTAQVVAFDGDLKADLVDVDVKPATHTDKDIDAAKMPLAGSIVAAARCSGGQNSADANYTVDGTEFEGVGTGGAPGKTLFPIPAGHTFTVRTKLKGFKDAQRAVKVDEGASADVELDMDADENDANRGCVSTGCSDGRQCNRDDGQCYECNNASDCKAAPGLHCEEHRCVPDSGASGARGACLPCTSDAQCQGHTYTNASSVPESQTGMCITNGGSRVCSYGCDVANADADCPSGFVCQFVSGTSGPTACFPLATCTTVLQAFGAVCLDDATCSAVLMDGHCQGLDKKRGTPGYCTSRCASDVDCPTLLGFRCDPQAALCVK